MAAAEVLALSQDMTISRDEFLRGLPGAVGGTVFAVAAGEIRPLAPGHGWRIVVDPLPDLCLGAVRLPRQRVAVFLAGYDEGATRRFLERFELYYRRGGG